jgi:putative ABC transport system permease protein
MSLAFRLAARELRSGVKGFRIFLACLALGVAAIAAAGSTAQAFREGLGAQSREILGGDIRIGAGQRRFTPAEQAAFARVGRVSYSAGARAMAQTPSGERRLVELRGVDNLYPLAGTVQVSGAANLTAGLAPRGGVAGALVEQALLDRLGLKVGDRFEVGNLALIVGGVITAEPDRVSRGFSLGPRVLVRLDAMERGGFLTPGYLFNVAARIALPAGGQPDREIAALRRALPDAQLRMTERSNAAAGFRRLIDRLEYFLGFIGLSSLVAGGLGVSGAVGAYLEARKPSIAVLKALGAEGPLIRDIYLIQIALLALLGVIIGLGLGAAAPLALGAIAGKDLPVPALFAIYPAPLIKAGAFGLLAAAAFSLGPLARARATPPASLFRRDLSARLTLCPETVAAGLSAVALAGLAVATAPTPLAAAAMIGGVAAGFVVLWLLGAGAAKAAGGLRGITRGAARIGAANLAGPRSAARTATPAIGLGIALLTTVVLIQSSLLAQVTLAAPQSAPAMVFMDVPGDRAAEFDAEVAQAFGEPLTPAIYQRFPYISGRVLTVRGQTLERSQTRGSGRRLVDNDLTMSAIGPQPANARITAGRWWTPDYAGPPLASIDREVAQGAGVNLGDPIVVEVLGVEIEARVASLREVDYGGFGPTFALILNPHALDGAPLRQIAIAKGDRSQEARATRALGASFPGVNVISVREQLEAAAKLFDRLSLAIRGAAGVAGLSGLLVLAGAIAAGAQARAREAAILKVLGASRLQVLSAYALEYGCVGAIAAVAGALIGAGAAWPVVTQVFEASFTFDILGVAALVGGSAALTGLFGLIAAAAALSRRPAPVLRSN